MTVINATLVVHIVVHCQNTNGKAKDDGLRPTEASRMVREAEGGTGKVEQGETKL